MSNVNIRLNFCRSVPPEFLQSFLWIDSNGNFLYLCDTHTRSFSAVIWTGHIGRCFWRNRELQRNDHFWAGKYYAHAESFLRTITNDGGSNHQYWLLYPWPGSQKRDDLMLIVNCAADYAFWPIAKATVFVFVFVHVFTWIVCICICIKMSFKFIFVCVCGDYASLADAF